MENPGYTVNNECSKNNTQEGFLIHHPWLSSGNWIYLVGGLVKWWNQRRVVLLLLSQNLLTQPSTVLQHVDLWTCSCWSGTNRLPGTINTLDQTIIDAAKRACSSLHIGAATAGSPEGGREGSTSTHLDWSITIRNTSYCISGKDKQMFEVLFEKLQESGDT